MYKLILVSSSIITYRTNYGSSGWDWAYSANSSRNHNGKGKGELYNYPTKKERADFVKSAYSLVPLFCTTFRLYIFTDVVLNTPLHTIVWAIKSKFT